MLFAPIAAPIRRDEVLAFVMERLVRDRVSPTAGEIAAHFGFSEARAKQLVKQLIELRRLERTPGAKRGLRVVDVAETRHLLQDVMRALGWVAAEPMGPLEAFPNSQLPLVAVLDHIPEVELGKNHGQPSGA